MWCVMVWFGLVAGEVARQNRITQHILAQYLQRRLFPQLTRSPSLSQLTSPRTRSPPPHLQTLDELLDQEQEQDQEEELDQEQQDQDPDQELETVESEQISNVYDNENVDFFNEGPNI